MTLVQFAQNFTSRIGIDAAAIVQHFKDVWDSATVNETLSPQTVINVRQIKYYNVLMDEIHRQTQLPGGSGVV